MGTTNFFEFWPNPWKGCHRLADGKWVKWCLIGTWRSVSDGWTGWQVKVEKGGGRVSLITPAECIISFPRFLRAVPFQHVLPGRENAKSIGTHNLSYQKKKKKVPIPPNFSQCNLLTVRGKLRKHHLFPIHIWLGPTQRKTFSSKGAKISLMSTLKPQSRHKDNQQYSLKIFRKSHFDHSLTDTVSLQVTAMMT